MGVGEGGEVGGGGGEIGGWKSRDGGVIDPQSFVTWWYLILT